MMFDLKSNRPSNYDGKGGKFIFRTWLYQVKQRLALIQVGEAAPINDAVKISFAVTFFRQ